MDIKQIIEKNHAGIEKLAKKYGAENIRFYSSGEAPDINEDKVNIIIALKKGNGLIGHAALIYELSDLLGITINVISEKDIREKKLTEIKGCSAKNQ